MNTNSESSILKTRKKRLFVGILFVLLLTGFIAYRYLTTRYQFLPSGLLALTIELEQTDPVGGDLQGLAEILTMLGRDHEVREKGFNRGNSSSKQVVDRMALRFVTWADGVKQIAAENQIVMISENHVDSKHREWIGCTLELFSDEGFTHYAAEALVESGQVIKHRGFPTIQTGWYTSDPKFGNLIRQAILLNYELVDYDHRSFYPDGRDTSRSRYWRI